LISHLATMFTILSLFLVGISLAARCEALGRLPNARFLGMGYNAIKGNPDDDLHDPGFAYNVLQFTWANESTTTDGQYFVPDHVQALQTKSCSFRSQAATEFGSRSYQESLSVDVSAEVSSGMLLWKARFSASIGYKTVRQETVQHRRFYTSARAKCIHYKLSINYQNKPISITRNFEQAVSSLPLVRDDKAYNSLIDKYGTHFTSSVTMGAKMVIRTEFDEIALNRMEEARLSIEIGAKASFLRFAGGLDTETTIERQQRETFEANRRSYSESYLGSHPPSDRRWETWAQSTANSPYPVRYKLAPLTALFTAKFFPNMPLNDLTKRRDLLTAAYNIYCSGISGCGTPPPDRVPVRVTKAVSRFRHSATVSCPPTYNLVSCGILNVRASGSHDRQRYAIPTYSRACECRDRIEAKCVSWCSNIAVQLRIASSPVIQGVPTATCPSGYKVVLSHSFTLGFLFNRLIFQGPNLQKKS